MRIDVVTRGFDIRFANMLAEQTVRDRALVESVCRNSSWDDGQARRAAPARFPLPADNRIRALVLLCTNAKTGPGCSPEPVSSRPALCGTQHGRQPVCAGEKIGGTFGHVTFLQSGEIFGGVRAPRLGDSFEDERFRHAAQIEPIASAVS
jgi:hypothetical protein